jgi:glutathione reductase (NADPH)
VKVDQYFESSVPNIYALGDVIDRIALTPVALAEGMALAQTLFNGNPTTVDYSGVPTAVFSQPSVGTVGLSELRHEPRATTSWSSARASSPCSTTSRGATSGP